jgi:hypothetical protein
MVDMLELRKIGDILVYFRKENEIKEASNQQLEHERIIKVLTDEDF